MLNKLFDFTLFKYNFRSLYKLMLIFFSIMVMYISIVISMFDPKMSSVFEEMSKVMPEIMAMMGMNTTSATLIGFICSYLYGMIMLVFPMIFIIIAANKLMVCHIDRGSMAYILSAPVSRTKVAFTQAKTLGIMTFIILFISVIIMYFFANHMFPNLLPIKEFIILNLGLVALHNAIGGICFFSASIFDDVTKSSLLSVGITVISFLMQMLGNIGEKFQFLKNFSFFTLFNPEKLVALENSAYVNCGILFLSGMIFYVCGIYIFSKRDLLL